MNISGYQLGRQVAVGQLSTVYNALNLENSKTVTVQEFNHSLGTNNTFRAQFKKAAEKLVSRRFGIMTPVLRAVVNDDECYLITEYFPCPEQASDELPELNVKQVLKIGLSIASTLSQLHEVGLIHGGIEKTSLLLTTTQQPVLSPIALHRALPALRLSSFTALTLEQQQYLAPEAEHELSEATDFYALGVLLYQLICQRPPFPADNAETLQQLKVSFNAVTLSNHHKHLQPLLSGLLATDKSERIQNIQDFEQALADCLLQLKKRAKLVQGSTDTSTVDLNPPNTETSNGRQKKYRLILAIALLIVISLPVYFLMQDGTKPSRDKQASTSQALKPRISIPQPPPVEDVVPAEDPDSSSEQYQLAQSSMQQGKYGRALMVINSALKSSPDNNQLKVLKRDIEREIAVGSLIHKAEKQISDLKLTRPAGDNALESYQFLQGLAKKQDDRIQQGFEKIASKYNDLATSAFNKGQHEEALELISTGFDVVQEYAPLMDLQKKIIDRLNLLAQQREKQRLAQEKRAREEQFRASQLAEQQRIREARLAEEQRIREEKQAEEQRMRELEAQRLAVEQEQERQKLRRLNQNKINTLLASAGKRLEGSTLTLPNINAAKREYLEIAGLDAFDNRIPQLKQDIVDSYVILANEQKNASQYDNALETLQQGFELTRQDQNLVQMHSEIQTLVNARNQSNVKTTPAEESEPQLQVPIIGTF